MSPERTMMDLMGATTAMAARYQHITDPTRQDVAKRLGGLLWEASGDDRSDGDDGPAGTREPA